MHTGYMEMKASMARRISGRATIPRSAQKFRQAVAHTLTRQAAGARAAERHPTESLARPARRAGSVSVSLVTSGAKRPLRARAAVGPSVSIGNERDTCGRPEPSSPSSQLARLYGTVPREAPHFVTRKPSTSRAACPYGGGRRAVPWASEPIASANRAPANAGLRAPVRTPRGRCAPL